MAFHCSDIQQFYKHCALPVSFVIQLPSFWLYDRCSVPGRGTVFFLYATASRPALELTQPPIQWVPAALSPGLERPGHEADHSPPSSSEVNNACSYTSTPQYAFTAWCLIKQEISFHGVVVSCFTFIFTFTSSVLSETEEVMGRTCSTHGGYHYVRGCIQKFLDWPLGARAASGTSLCH
jgi:hypothetical protein